MKKHLVIIVIALMAATIFSACGTKENKNGVLINGTYWATCDVDMPDTFTESPEEEGMCYQWGTKEPIIPNGDNIWNEHYENTKWAKSDDPCPKGWQIPTMYEMASLLDSETVARVWTDEYGMIGMKFTDIANGNSIFLPAYGYYYANKDSGLPLYKGRYGTYWSSTGTVSDMAYQLGFCESDAVICMDLDDVNFAFRIRCVRE
jgi:uncharacterized protein (TIGR02145 family)